MRDPGAMIKKLFEEMWGPVCGFFHQRFGHRQTAEDLAGETFERVWACLQDGDACDTTITGRHLVWRKAWQVYSKHLKRRRRKSREPQEEPLRETEAPGPLPDELLVELEQKRLALELLLSWPGAGGSILRMRFVEQRTWHEIAVATGGSLTNARDLFYDALVQVARELRRRGS